jgi:hypothetical protein
VKSSGILVIVTLVLITNIISLPASIILSTSTLPSRMPARPIKKICEAAAVVVYVRCPITHVLYPLPAGTRPQNGQEVGLTLDAN